MLKKTVFYDFYHNLPGVRLVDFAGFEMPIQFEKGILAEHKLVRVGCGIFDVSHMGRLFVDGRDAKTALDRLFTTDMENLSLGKVLYGMMCNVEGGVEDDVLIYGMGDAGYLVVPNASNKDKVLLRCQDFIKSENLDCRIEDATDTWGQLAFQGPTAVSILSFIPDINELKYFTFLQTQKPCSMIISRTGYTGEKGFEICMPHEELHVFAKDVLEPALKAGAVFCGLGARDTLRMEAALPLYGHELNAKTSPIESGLGSFIRKSGSYLGRDAVEAREKNPSVRGLFGLWMEEKAVPRQGFPVYSEKGKILGEVTSGGFSVTCDGFMAMALLQRSEVQIGDLVFVDTGRKKASARIRSLPFYKRVR